MPQTILIVDDSSAIRKFVSIALKMKGYNILSANDGMEALEILPNNHIDLLLTDLNMPQIDGISLVKTVRKDIEYKNLPIIILSSLSDEKDIKVGLEAGANSYLLKPFDTQVIQDEVLKYLEK